MKALKTYEFGPFRLEVDERRLLRGNEPIPLRGKVFETLCALVESQGRLLTKEELLQSVWPNTAVEENNLNHTVSVLRKALGERATGQTYIETVPRVGYRFVANVSRMLAPAASVDANVESQIGPADRGPRQEIRFCRAADGVRIAYSQVGSGYPLVKAANWMNHLEFEWNSPIWKHWVEALYPHHTLIRYDERGNGLSDWNAEDLSFNKWVTDLETVVDAMHLEKFALLGISQGGAVAIAYAVKHPERVSHLVLYGAFARGFRHRDSVEEIARRDAAITLVRLGWGTPNPAFRQFWTTVFMPEATPEHMAWFNELQRVSTSPKNAAILLSEAGDINVTHLLADVKVPTIVFHCEEENAVPFQEGRILASAIAGARFVPLPGKNHLLMADEPAWRIFVEELAGFLGWSDIASGRPIVEPQRKLGAG
jgi:DNA-binding winged helix-turn-helix (wHTH) protein/pimeloyl-ACP methyl ester carboxylesterase